MNRNITRRRGGRFTMAIAGTVAVAVALVGCSAGANTATEGSAAAAGEIRVTTVDCLGNCKRRMSAALLRDGCWSYVFGDLTTESGPELITGAKLFAGSTDGLIPWRGRPDSLKRGLVARIPPLDQLKDIA